MKSYNNSGYYKTRELPPSAGFPPPSGGVAPLAPHGARLGNPRLRRRWKKQMIKIWDAMGVPNGASAYAAFGGDEKKNSGALSQISGAPIRGRLRRPKWFLKRDPFHGDSKYVLGFEIGQRESGFSSEQTESPNHPVRYYYVDNQRSHNNSCIYKKTSSPIHSPHKYIHETNRKKFIKEKFVLRDMDFRS